MKHDKRKEEKCFINTSDNFHPNFPNNQVELSYCINKFGCYVSVWGADDDGYNKSCNIDEVRDIYRKIKTKGMITKKELIGMGFEFGS